MLYGGKSSDSLADLRYAKYMKMVSEYVTIKPETMPPTTSAAAFHAYRAFYHTQKWIRYSYKEIVLETHLRLNLNFWKVFMFDKSITILLSRFLYLFDVSQILSKP